MRKKPKHWPAARDTHHGTTQRHRGQQQASPYLTLELFFGLEGFIARDPEGVRILTADVGVRTNKETGQRTGALERLRLKRTHRELPAPLSVLSAKRMVLAYDRERAGLNPEPYFFAERPRPE